MLLSRAAAAEMFPPERRARGISIVLFARRVRRDLGPARLRADVLRAARSTPHELVVPWLAAGLFTLAGLSISFGVRPDPKELSQRCARRGGDRRPQRRCARSSAARASPTAMVAAVASFGVMVGVMNLAGYVAVGHGHAQGDVFTIISAHIVGMYGLVLVVGDLIERIGRRRRW